MSVRPYYPKKNLKGRVHPNHRKRPIKPIPKATHKKLHALDLFAAQATLEGGECAASEDQDIATKIRECSCMRNGAVIALFEAGYTVREIAVILDLGWATVRDVLRKLRAKGVDI